MSYVTPAAANRPNAGSPGTQTASSPTSARTASPNERPGRKRITVVVLGDIGRSPRMQYHALALADAVGTVDLVGYSGTEPYAAVRSHPRINPYYLPWRQSEAEPELPRFLFLGRVLLRVLKQSGRLLWVLLFGVQKPQVILVQNPPAIPTLLAAWIVARVRSAKLVIDWHNFGFAMLALKLGPEHLAVRLARWYEGAMARRADAHLCVSRAMRSELEERWGIDATVLYDRPAAMFTPTPPPLRDELFHRLHREVAWPALDSPSSERPAVIVSPTSWTADEDFSVLLDAAVRCDELIRMHDLDAKGLPFPHLLVLLSGRGPLRGQYEAAISRMMLRKIHLRTLWVSPEDYPLLLGAADLGLCLHRSASGVDLPMKLADMFGAGLPVCALDYGECLREQVRPGENGLLFSTGAELAEQMYDLFKRFPDETPLLDALRRNLARRSLIRWEDGWMAEAQPLFSQP